MHEEEAEEDEADPTASIELFIKKLGNAAAILGFSLSVSPTAVEPLLLRVSINDSIFEMSHFFGFTHLGLTKGASVGDIDGILGATRPGKGNIAL